MAMRIKWEHFADSIKACVEKVSTKSAGFLTDAEAKENIMKLARATHENGGGLAELEAQAQALADEVLSRIRMDKKGALENLIKRTQVAKKATGAVEPGAPAQVSGEEAAFRLFSEVTPRPGAADAVNAESLGYAMREELLSGVAHQLRQQGLWTQAASREMATAIRAAMVDIHEGRTPKGEAGKIAQILFDGVRATTARLNKEGAWIQDPLAYFQSFDHNIHLMGRGGRRGMGLFQRNRANLPAKSFNEARDVWVKDVLGWVDPKSFTNFKRHAEETDLEFQTRYLQSVFKGRVLGVRDVMGKITDEAFDGPPSVNLARRISEGRDLVWKDAASWTAYNEKYGIHGNMLGMTESAVRYGSKLWGLMNKFGPNPADNLRRVVTIIQQSFKEDLNGLNDFTMRAEKGTHFAPSVDAIVAEMDGRATTPRQGGLWKVEQLIRPYYASTALGSAGVTNLFATIPASFSTGRTFFGDSTFKSLATSIKHLLSGPFSRQQRYEIAQQLRAQIEGFGRVGYADTMYGETIPGMVSATAKRLIQISGVNYIIDRVRDGIRFQAANRFALDRGKTFAELHPKFQQTLQEYGLVEHWDTIRAAKPSMVDGVEYLAPGDVGGDVGLRMSVLFADAANAISGMPGARERAIMRFGTTPGSPAGFLAASTTMFLSSPLAATFQTLGRLANNSQGTNKAAGIGIFISLALTTGYMKIALMNEVNGTPPPVPESPGEAMKLIIQSLAVSGGMGLLGDWIYSTFMRPGAENGDLLGLPINTALQSGRILYKWAESGFQENVWPETIRLTKQQIPFQNLLWTRSAMDYLFWFHAFEWASPGWWERSNQFMQRESGYTRFGYSPGRGVPSLPFGLGQ